jgi:hypothetical protein
MSQNEESGGGIAAYLAACLLSYRGKWNQTWEVQQLHLPKSMETHLIILHGIYL